MHESSSIRLFCLPYAGASAAVYLRWRRRLPAWVVLHPLELPGHGRRIEERLETEVERMVDGVLGEVKASLERPFAIFGHSLGAVLAFELALRLSELGLPTPRVVLASGSDAPSCRDLSRYAALESSEDLVAELERLRGTPPEVLANRELMALTLPILRADFAACARYRSGTERRLSCPLHVLAGADDATTSETLGAWREHTTGEFSLHVLPGGHFFLHEHEAQALAWLEARLERALLRRPRRDIASERERLGELEGARQRRLAEQGASR